MNSENFIGHTDPTRDISKEISEVSLEKQYAQLTEREKLLVFCRLNRYSNIPVSVTQLIEDEYFLGNEHFFGIHGEGLYQYWKDKLDGTIFSGPFTRKPFLVLSGAIGIGKSTVSRVAMLMTLHRLLCMKNPYWNLHLSPKSLNFLCAHRDENTAETEFKRWFYNDVLEYSPYFRNTPATYFKYKVNTSGPRGSMGLGSDLIYFCGSEVNFFPGDGSLAQEKIATALGRLTSRIDNDVLQKVGHFIIDSSAKGASSPTEWFLNNTDPELTWNCTPTQWEVKPKSYPSLKTNNTFPVYIGDGKYPPQILPRDYKLGLDQDPGRVLEVPMELEQEAKIDLQKMLMDKAGKAISSSDLFFGGSIEHLVKCSSVKNVVPEIITVDFYDKTEKLYDKIKPALSSIPYKSPLWIGLDLATKSDLAGLSIITFDGWNVVNNVKLPKIKVLVVTAIGRKEGQQTSLFHFEDLLFELHRKYNIVVSADQAYSAQLLQDCEREGIKTNYISTDNSPCEPALYLKNLINNELLVVPENKRLQRETYDLRYTYTTNGRIKIDHPKKATQDPKVFDINNGVGSKDTWDGLASACYSLKLSIDSGEEYGVNGGFQKSLQSFSNLTKNPREEATKEIQNMIENIF